MPLPTQAVRLLLRKHLSLRSRRWLHRFLRPAFLGTMRRTQPISTHWGFNRGNPVDRYYIENFLGAHRQDIAGRVLEVQSPWYARMFGTAAAQIDILDIDPHNKEATVIADLARADNIEDATYDCFVLTQTLHLIFDAQAALMHSARILKPGGVLLATVPCLSRIDPDTRADQWRFTPASCARLFESAFPGGNVTITSHGCVLTAVGFLTGMAAGEFTKAELDFHDPDFPLLICIRAIKA